MAHFNTSCSFVSDASYKVALQRKVCPESSVKARIAALEKNLSAAPSTTRSPLAPKPVFERRCTTTVTQTGKPSSLRSFKPAETQARSDSSGSSTPSRPKNAVMNSARRANTGGSKQTSFSLEPAKPAWINYRRSESTLKPETQESRVPSFPKAHQNTKLSLAQQNCATKEQSLTGSYSRVENIICFKPPKLPQRQKPKYDRTCGTQNNVQRESADPPVRRKSLPDELSLRNPPPKPTRPPGVDIHRFRRHIQSLNDGEEQF